MGRTIYILVSISNLTSLLKRLKERKHRHISLSFYISGGLECANLKMKRGIRARRHSDRWRKETGTPHHLAVCGVNGVSHLQIIEPQRYEFILGMLDHILKAFLSFLSPNFHVT
jgi:hypothetical protein